MTDPEAVLDRVRKLLALSSSPNVHEAAAAAARAQALVARHRLEDRLAAEARPELDPDPIVDGWHTPLEVARRLRRWKVALAVALADVNGCLAYTAVRASDEALVLVGRGRDREAIGVLWSWLVPRIEWLSATHGPGRSRRWHDAFRIGAVDAIAQRLMEGGAELDATALARVEARHRSALDRFVSEHLRLGSGRPVRVHDGRAWSRGQAAAAELTLPPR